MTTPTVTLPLDEFRSMEHELNSLRVLTKQLESEILTPFDEGRVARNIAEDLGLTPTYKGMKYNSVQALLPVIKEEMGVVEGSFYNKKTESMPTM